MAGFSQDPGKINWKDHPAPLDHEAVKQGRKEMISVVIGRVSGLVLNYSNRRLNGGLPKTYGEAMTDVSNAVLEIIAEEIGVNVGEL